MRRKNEQTLQEVMKEVLKKYKLEKRFEQTEIGDVWKKMLGPSVANQTRKVVLRNGVMTVFIDSALVKQEMNMLKSQLVVALNEAMGTDVVTELRIL